MHFFNMGFDQMPCQARPGAAGAPAPDQAVGKCTPPALARGSVMWGAIPRPCCAVCHGHCALRTSPLAVVMCRCAEYQLHITHRLKLASLHIFFELPPLMKPPGTENQRPKNEPTPAAPALSRGRGCPGSGIRTTTKPKFQTPVRYPDSKTRATFAARPLPTPKSPRQGRCVTRRRCQDRCATLISASGSLRDPDPDPGIGVAARPRPRPSTKP